MNGGVERCVRRDHMGIRSLKMLVRPLDEEVSFASRQISHFDARMGMASGATADRDFGNTGNGGVTVRKFGFLQRRALDASFAGRLPRRQKHARQLTA